MGSFSFVLVVHGTKILFDNNQDTVLVSWGITTGGSLGV
jgi:hypothetical protein